MIHLVRHARPAATGVLWGSVDVPLSATPLPSPLRVRSVFASPLRRALDTATALFPSASPLILPALTEISLGEWDGKTWDEIVQRDAAAAERKLEDWFGVTPPGGEDYHAIVARAQAALHTIQRAPHPVAIVAHVGINAILWQLLTGAPAVQFRQDYLEVITHAPIC